MNRKEIRKLNERIANDKLVGSLNFKAQIQLFEQMLEIEGLAPLDSFEAIPSTDLVLDEKTDVNNRWQKVNSAICDLEEIAMERKFQEYPFDTIQAACKALRTLKANFLNEGEDIKTMGLTEIHTA